MRRRFLRRSYRDINKLISMLYILISGHHSNNWVTESHEKLNKFRRMNCPFCDFVRENGQIIAFSIWAASWQNQQNGMCAQQRLSSAWASESSLSPWRKLGSLATYWAHSKDSDQTRPMPRLIRVFAGRTVILLVFSGGSSY